MLRSFSLRGRAPASLLAPAALALALVWPRAAGAADVTLRYPTAARGPVVDTVHGVKLPDPYRWLEDATSAATKAWMAAEDKLARDFSAHVPGHDKLRDRLAEVYYVDALFPPVKRGARYFYRRTPKGQERPNLYLREGEHGAERLLIDTSKLSPDGTTTLGDFSPSWDGSKVAYIAHPNNSDAGVLYVLDVASGQRTSDVLTGADYTALSWTPGNDALYYTWLPSKEGKPSDADRFAKAELRVHKLGTAQAADVRAHEPPGNAEVFVGGNISKDGHWLFYEVTNGSDFTEIWYRDLRKANLPWQLLTPPKVNAFYEIDVHHDVFYVSTNEGAPRWRVFRVDPAHPARSAWRELIPERKDVVLQPAAVVGGHLLVPTTHDATSGVEIYSLDGKLVRALALPGPGTVDHVQGDPDDDALFLRFTSFTTPDGVFRTSIAKGGLEPWGDHHADVDMSRYTVEQVWYPSKDGTQISMFILHRTDLRKDGATPFILNGYGGFALGIQPSWHPELVPWLEAGGAYAVANLRGGNEYGEDWHKAGMREKKQNVFDDYVAAAQWLIAQKYTRPDKLAIYGRSNGGLLVGAAMTQHPELYRAVLCGVPLLDMVRYHLFGGGKTWIPEYGSPDQAKDFAYLYAYSPYHHLRAGTKYPALYMLSADADDRVEPMHARKFVAALQALQGGSAADGRPVLLRIEQHSGHAGGDRPAYNSQLVGYWADAYAFLMRELGMK